MWLVIRLRMGKCVFLCGRKATAGMLIREEALKNGNGRLRDVFGPSEIL